MNKWLFTINGIKGLLQGKSTIESTIKICKELSYQLRKVQSAVDTKTSFDEEDRSYIYYELEQVISDFEFITELLDGTIAEEEWIDYGFDISQREELFNSYLNGLYNLADEQFTLKTGKIIKLLWVG